MKPSIWTDAFVELQPEESLERMARIGWKYIELADKHWRDVDARKNPRSDFKALRQLCERLDITMPQVHGPMFNLCGDAQTVRNGTNDFKRCLRWAGVLRVKWVVLHPGSAPLAEDEKAFESVRQTNLKALQKLLDEARKHNVGIAIENTCDGTGQGKRSFGVTPAELLWLVRKSDPRSVGICWDTGHANIQRLDQHRAISALGKHLVATHIADNDTSGDQHLLPFEGNIDWKAVVTALRDLKYRGLFNLEIGGAVHRVPLAAREAKLRYALELTQALVDGRVP